MWLEDASKSDTLLVIISTVLELGSFPTEIQGIYSTCSSKRPVRVYTHTYIYILILIIIRST